MGGGGRWEVFVIVSKAVSGIGDGRRGGEGHMPPQILRLGGHGGGTCIFELRPHTTSVRFCNHMVQIMASQRTLDTWLPAANKKKTLFDKR